MRDKNSSAQVRRDDTGEWEVAFRSGFATILGGGHGPALTIPDVVKVDGRESQVRVVGARAFRGRNLASVTLPETLVFIDGFAFERNNLTTVSIPPSVTGIADFAFSGNALTEVRFSEGIAWIGGWAFADNDLRQIALPASVAGIFRGAFSSNELERIDFAGAVRAIEAEAFAAQYSSRVLPVALIELRDAAGAVWDGLTVTGPMNITGAPALVRPGRHGRARATAAGVLAAQ